MKREAVRFWGFFVGVVLVCGRLGQIAAQKVGPTPTPGAVPTNTPATISTPTPIPIVPTPAPGLPTATPPPDMVGRLRGVTLAGFKKTDFAWRGDGVLIWSANDQPVPFIFEWSDGTVTTDKAYLKK